MSISTQEYGRGYATKILECNTFKALFQVRVEFNFYLRMVCILPLLNMFEFVYYLEPITDLGIGGVLAKLTPTLVYNCFAAYVSGYSSRICTQDNSKD